MEERKRLKKNGIWQMKPLELYKKADNDFNRAGREILDWINNNTKPNESYLIGIQKKGSIRSLQANAFYFGHVCKTVSEETGHTVEEVHEFNKFKFNLVEKKIINPITKKIETQTVGGTTTKMTVKRFNELINDAMFFYTTELGIIFDTFDNWVVTHSEEVEQYSRMAA